jgi:hypothetical protein
LDVFSRTLISLLTAAAVGGGALAAPTQAAPAADLTQQLAGQSEPTQTDAEKYSVSYGIFVMHGETATGTPLEDDLPAGTVVTLEEGAALASFRSHGWIISMTDNTLSVTPPETIDGRFEIPLLVTYPDQSTEAAIARISVDYYVDIPDWIMSSVQVLAPLEPLWSPHFSPFEQSSASRAVDEASARGQSSTQE